MLFFCMKVTVLYGSTLTIETVPLQTEIISISVPTRLSSLLILVAHFLPDFRTFADIRLDLHPHVLTRRVESKNLPTLGSKPTKKWKSPPNDQALVHINNYFAVKLARLSPVRRLNWQFTWAFKGHSQRYDIISPRVHVLVLLYQH